MPFGVVVGFKDKKAVGGVSSTIIHLPDATAWGDVVIFAQEIAKLIDPLLKGIITRIGVSYEVTLPGTLNTTIDDEADVEEGGRFNWYTDGGHYTSNRIPTFDEALVTVGGVGINQAAPDVAAFFGAMINGIDVSGLGGVGTPAPCDSRGEDITTLLSAIEDFQSS